MWRLLSVLIALLALAGLSMSHGSTPARAAAQKQLICHVDTDTIPVTAHIIEVAEPAVPAHLRNHGDCLINSTDRSLIGQPCDFTDADNNDVCDVQP